MGSFTEKYRLSIYTEVVEISKDKVYIVKSSLDDKIYIKKVLAIENYEVYKKIKDLKIKDIPKIYEIIKLDGSLVIIEEYINGSSLKEILDESKTLSEGEVIKYIIDLINILKELHSSKPVIIHRDIKPSNIMINNDNILKLIDFDISRVHKTNKSTDTIILGTYGYAAPEQFGFNQSDERTDVYSIGVTMNMMLTGSLPTEETYKGPLRKIIAKCIQLDPNKRFQTTKKLKDELLKEDKKDNKKLYNKDSKLPGFKSNILFFKIIGSIWYIILAMSLLGFFEEEPISKDRIETIMLVIFMFLLTLLYGNYRDIKSKLPIISSSNILIRLLGYVIYTIGLFIVYGLTITV